jgi:small-conductance mechanosensitive channel
LFEEDQVVLTETLIYGNTTNVWLAAGLIAAGVFVVTRIARAILVRRLGSLAQKTENVADDLLVALIGKTRTTFLFVIALYAGSGGLALNPGASKAINIAIVVIVLVQALIWGNAVISFLLVRALRQRAGTDGAGATSLAAFGVVARIAFFSIVLLIGLENLGVNITGLVAGLGIGGIAVALALQNVLGDLFASLSIALDKPFVIGDFVVVDGVLGTVEYIGLKTTRIRSLSGEQIVVANANLLNSTIHNYKRMEERRALFTFGVTYQTPKEKLAAISSMVEGIIGRHAGTRFDRAHFKAYADSSLLFEVVYFILSPDYNRYMDIQQAINLEIFERFEAEGIDFAYPTQTIHISDRQMAGAAVAKP